MGTIKAYTVEVVIESNDPRVTKADIDRMVTRCLEDELDSAVLSRVRVTKVSKPYPDNLED